MLSRPARTDEQQSRSSGSTTRNVNTYANSVIESSPAVMKFMGTYIRSMVSTVGVSKCIFCVNK